MQQKEFRPDLYFRLNTFTLMLPPLRERADDIPLLAEYFLQRFRQDLGVDVRGISPESLDLLKRYHWPGNVARAGRVCVSNCAGAFAGRRRDAASIARQRLRST